MPTKGADQVSDWSVCIGLCVEVKGTLDLAVLQYMYMFHGTFIYDIDRTSNPRALFP